MKEILILADGVLAKHFITRLTNSKINLYHYTIISADERITNMEISKNRFSLHNFDPTSLSKLKFAIDCKIFAQVIIVMANKKDTIACYENIRSINREFEIVMLSMWSLSDIKQTLEKDRRLDIVDGKNTMSTRLIDSMPDLPVFADNIGLGVGEIMEVKVPSDSPYAYRSIGSLQQRKWRIALIIRSDEIILPNSAEKIRPGDSLITVGDPNVLENVFRAIKREQPQFPNPFGPNIYCIIDMKTQSDKDIISLINSCLYLHYKLSNKILIFKVINPTLNQSFNILKDLNESGVNVIIDYDKTDPQEFYGDPANLDVGLVVTDDEHFFKFKKLYYQLKLPILKLGKMEIGSVSTGVILGGDENELQAHSAVIMDICSQLGLVTELFCFDMQNNGADELTYYFDGLARLFEKSVKINIHTDTNPLIYLSKKHDLLQFVIFEPELAGRDLFAIFSNQMNRLYKKLRSNAQLFIPSIDKF